MVQRALTGFAGGVMVAASIWSMKDNMFVMTMYAGAFLIALYK